LKSKGGRRERKLSDILWRLILNDILNKNRKNSFLKRERAKPFIEDYGSCFGWIYIHIISGPLA
jgi:hypothetical protein